MSWHQATSGAPGSNRRADEVGDPVAVGAGEGGAAGAAGAAPVSAGHAVQAHQAGHPLAVHDHACLAERLVHARHAVVAIGVVEQADASAPPAPPRPAGARSAPPSRVRASRSSPGRETKIDSFSNDGAVVVGRVVTADDRKPVADGKALVTITDDPDRPDRYLSLGGDIEQGGNFFVRFPHDDFRVIRAEYLPSPGYGACSIDWTERR